MNITIFPTGKGGSESAVRYLLSDTDHEGKKRSVLPEILFGDPKTFIEIANATSRLHKYTSGVVAFRDRESLTQEQINSVVEIFRSTFLPGMKADENFADFWVLHRDKGNLELHFLVANTELTTGQQLNIHPPGQKNIQLYNAFVAVMNDNFGFAQVVPDPLKIALKPFEAKSENGKKDKKAKSDFAKLLHSEIVNGFISNRNQLIGHLKKSKIDIALIGDDFITVRLPGARRNTRLKGPLFSKDSDYAELVKQHHQSKIPKFLSLAEAQEQKTKLVAEIESRAAFNQRRYFGPRPGAKPTQRASKLPTANLPHRVARRQDELDQKVMPVPAKEIRSTLMDQLTQLKEQAEPTAKLPAADLPHRVARQQDERDREGSLSSVIGGSAGVVGLEAQIGNLSMQYHTLKLLLISATGRRAEQIKAQLFAVEQRLAALSLELEKKRLQANDPLKPAIT
ncbi:relaxase/mobilization nuclease domain-containing protein [Ralstonia pseudosolanacearum]|uniref:relaxase/mobilization nuclease domain-containing protein n=1 Tax=Ralstonia pseudosolanacearum TaxID=1310165 RepID=UPI0026765DCC|nr:relaxase/mobilization nuclease domain-containing protein [Ralstonia pseudosolanacearum]MDO3552054.1 relaxase/mobilization nuclease domain-containing protein [Ralstonia pseudosolanacearum]